MTYFLYRRSENSNSATGIKELNLFPEKFQEFSMIKCHFHNKHFLEHILNKWSCARKEMLDFSSQHGTGWLVNGYDLFGVLCKETGMNFMLQHIVSDLSICAQRGWWKIDFTQSDDICHHGTFKVKWIRWFMRQRWFTLSREPRYKGIIHVTLCAKSHTSWAHMWFVDLSCGSWRSVMVWVSSRPVRIAPGTLHWHHRAKQTHTEASLRHSLTWWVFGLKLPWMCACASVQTATCPHSKRRLIETPLVSNLMILGYSIGNIDTWINNNYYYNVNPEYILLYCSQNWFVILLI